MDFYEKYDPGFDRTPKKHTTTVQTIFFLFLSALAVIIPLFLNYEAIIENDIGPVNVAFTAAALLAWAVLLTLGRKYPLYTTVSALYWGTVTFCGITSLVIYYTGVQNTALKTLFIAAVGYLCSVFYIFKDIGKLAWFIALIGTAGTIYSTTLTVRELLRRRATK